MNGILLRLQDWRDTLSDLVGWRRRLAAMVLGIVAALALPPVYGVVFLIPAISGLIWILDGADRPRRAFFDGWWFGFGFFAAGLYCESCCCLEVRRVYPVAFQRFSAGHNDVNGDRVDSSFHQYDAVCYAIKRRLYRCGCEDVGCDYACE